MRRVGRITAGLAAALMLAIGAGCGGSSSSSSGSSQSQPPATSSAPKNDFCGAAGQLASLQAQLIPLVNSLGDAQAIGTQLDRLETRAQHYQQQAPAQLRDDIDTLQGTLSKLTSAIEQHPGDPGAIAAAVSGTVQSAQSAGRTGAHPDLATTALLATGPPPGAPGCLWYPDQRPLRGRLMVGRLTLDQVVGVRVPAPQP